jgi:hypothetical protein
MYQKETVTVAASGTDSTGGFGDGLKLVGIAMPAALTSTTLTLKCSTDGSTWKTHVDDLGVAVTIPCAASQYINVFWLGVVAPYVQLVMGSAEGAARTITLVFADA